MTDVTQIEVEKLAEKIKNDIDNIYTFLDENYSILKKKKLILDWNVFLYKIRKIKLYFIKVPKVLICLLKQYASTWQWRN